MSEGDVTEEDIGSFLAADRLGLELEPLPELATGRTEQELNQLLVEGRLVELRELVLALVADNFVVG